MKRPTAAEEPVWIRYRLFLHGVMLYYISDILWGILYESKITVLAYTDTMLYFFSMALSLLLWMRFTVAYLDQKNIFEKVLLWSGWIIFWFDIVTIIINLFKPVMFTFTKNGEYYTGQARYLNLFMQMILFGLMSVYTMICTVKAKKQDRFHNAAVAASGLFMTVFIILQAEDPLLPYYSIGCLVATCIMHSFVELDHERELDSVKKIAYKDPLTNVRNVNAYTQAKEAYEEQIKSKEIGQFGIMVFDLNDLKKVNDSKGHEAGDRYLKDAAKLICEVLKHSPVFRIGGDEFVSFLEGDDYNNRNAHVDSFLRIAQYNANNGGPVVSCGMDIYDPEKDNSFDDVFFRADSRMYECKKSLKNV
jgi:diguanylate cyclase (GGDEF)-like protein